MTKGILLAALTLMLAAGPALAHGGGGGGGGGHSSGGGHYTYTPIFIGGGVAPGLPAPELGDMSHIHTVAVLSGIGLTMQLQDLHFLGDQTKSLEISDWKIDDLVAATLRQYLASRFTFKDVAYDRAALEVIPNGHLDTKSREAVAKYLAGIPSDGLDAFIVIHPDLEGGNPGLEGIGLQGGANQQAGPTIWINFEIDIIDAHTFKYISKVTSRAQLRGNTTPGLPGFVMRADVFTLKDVTPTPQQTVLLHLALQRYVPLTLVETLRPLSIAADLPPPGGRKIVDIPRDKDPHAAIKTVAIVSAIGDSIQLIHTGTWGTGRSNDTLPVADWNFDTDVEATIRAAVSRRFTVKDANIDRSALYNVRFRTPDGKWRDTVSELPTRNDIDAYIVVLKYPTPVLEVPGNGIGIANQSNLGGSWSFLYADYAIGLVDAHTLKLITGRAGLMGPAYPQEWPTRNEPDTVWPTKPPAIDAAQLATLHVDLKSLVNDSLPETLLRLALTGQAAVVGMPSAPPPVFKPPVPTNPPAQTLGH